MLLNQIWCEDGDPENLLRKSFYQFQTDRAIPDLEKQAKELEVEKDSIVIEEDSLNDYYHLLLVRIQCNKNVEEPPTFSTEDQVTWGVIINFEKLKDPSEGSSFIHAAFNSEPEVVMFTCLPDETNKKPEDASYKVDVLTRCAVSKDAVGKKIDNLSSIRIIIAKDLLPLEVRQNTLKKISEVLSRFSKGVPLLDPEEDMKVQNNDYKKKVRRLEALEGLFDKHQVAKSPLIEQKLKALHMKKELKEKIKSVREAIRSSTALAFKDELKARKRVLRRLGQNSKSHHKVSIDVEHFVNSFGPDIMEVVYAWANGSKFCEIMEITQVFEGSLIRAIRRLEEILQQLIQAAKSIGDTQLESKFEEAVSKIKRDIVFAASLYL
ncbi:hypothetical protein Syun_001832 [Stephania yunnanensis]|uniref:ATP-dependent RNA helicase Ski2/MTR4 C-terminal domain-containing protein n=1 Tax=Stephania yunnanensis TaxID=152371 RepID=A0AAP0LEE5_9MAGN